MDNTDLKALQGSIAKWQAIVDGTGVDEGVKNCPLCILRPFNCDGCPVAESPSYDMNCSDQYSNWAHHQSAAHRTEVRKIHCPDCLSLAQAELDFLKSLLPTPEGTIK